jgi:hypothetical protein
MTRSQAARPGETTISMIHSYASLNDRGDFSTRQDSVSSRQVAVEELREHKSNSGTCYVDGKEVRMFNHDTGAAIASPQLLALTDSHVDEKSAAPLPDRRTRFLSSHSSSTKSRLVDRLGTRVYSLSSSRTIPSWRNTFPRAHGAYARIERGHDVDGGSDSGAPGLPHLRDGASPSQHSSSGNLRDHSLRQRRRYVAKRTTSQNNVFHTPLSDLVVRFSHVVTNSTSGHHDPDTIPSSRSLSTYNSSSDGSRIPFPSTPDGSYRTYPSPYSADAAAVFQTQPDKSDASYSYFGGHVKHRGIFDDQIQVVFEEGTNRTSTSASASTSAISERTVSKPRGLLVRMKKRVSALAGSMKHTRRKFTIMLHEKWHPPRRVDDNDNDDPVEYDIPCLAYVTCLW